MKLDSWWPDVFSARASCADAAVDLLGLPYEFWSLGLFLLIGAAMLLVLRRPTAG
jgi:disulfide bond formation protein DsbB